MVISSSLFSFEAKHNFKDWQNDVLPNLSQTRFRRAGRFAIATICGALGCLKDSKEIDDIKIYFASANGDITNTIESQDSIFLQSLFPMPFSFINTLNNTPLFYLMQYLKIKNSGISMASKNFAFEQNLSLALIDLKQKRTKYALIGVCDVWFLPKELANKFLDENAHEFSAWLLLKYDVRNFAKFFYDFDDLVLEIMKLDGKKDMMLSSQITVNELATLSEYINKVESNIPLCITNESSFVSANYFKNNKKTAYYYIGKDERFGYSFIHLN